MSKNYVDLKVSELRDECKNRNLDTTGLKVHLVERLNKYDREQLMKSKIESKPGTIVSSSTNLISKLLEESKRNSYDDNQNNDKREMVSDDRNPSSDKSYGKEDRKRPHQSNEENNQSESMNKENLLSLACVERDNWDKRTDVHLDYYNSDMNLVIDGSGTIGTPLHEDGFEYACAGARATFGIDRDRAFFEVTIVRRFEGELGDEVGEKSFIRIGWSVDNGVMSLGETRHSFGFDNSGKVMTSGNESEYGVVCGEGDVVGCFLEFNEDCFLIRYSINGVDQGEAFNVLNRDLNGSVLFPHIYVKNMSFEVNFGQNGNPALFPPSSSTDDECWSLIGHLGEHQRIRAMLPPKSKGLCEVLMMCGLPSCGKTHWTEQQIRDHSEKRYNVLSINTVLEKMKVNNLRKKVSPSRWDSFILSATQCLNKLIEIAVSRKRNFILDQTNVYPTAQRRRMKPFEEFIRKAIIIVPADDEYQRRMNQVIQEEGKDVPESAVLQMKENFVIPEEGSDLFNEIIFIELQRSEAEQLIKKYNEEAKNQKKKESLSDSKGKREKNEDEEDEDFGKWASNSPKAANEDSEPSAPKKSRWNAQTETRKKSKSKERSYDRGSSDRGSSDRRKNDYKGGFCFSREASDSGRGGSSGFRSDSNRHDKSRDQRNDRSGSGPNKSGYSSSGSGSGSYRRGGDASDRKPRFDNNNSRDDSRFGGGNRNQMGGSGGNNRDSRPRDRGNDSRGGSQFSQGNRDRSRGGGGGFSDRRGGNSYDEGDSRGAGKFSQSTTGGYGDRGSGMNSSTYPSSNNQERSGNSRFGSALAGGSQNTMSSDRSDFRGRGRGSGGAAGGNKDSFNERSRNMGAQEHREFPNYSDFNLPPSFQDNRYSSGGNSSSNNQMPWQQSSDYSNKPADPRLAHGGAGGGGGYDSRGGNQGGNYDNNYQFGGGAGGGQRGSSGNRGGKIGAPQNEMQSGNSNSYYNTNTSSGGNERKPQNMRGGGGGSMNRGGGRGGPSASPIDNYSNEDYSYGGGGGMNKNYETGGGAPMQKYKQPQQGGASYSDSGMMGGGNSGSGSGYKDYSRPDMMNYSSAGASGGNKPQSRQGGYMGGQSSDMSGGMKKPDYSSSRDAYSDSYDDYQSSYDNSQYGQNSSYYNYYSGTDSGPKADSQQQQQQSQQASSYQQSSSNRVAGYQSYVSASSGVTGGGYSSTGGGYQSATATGGYGGGYQQPQAASYPTSSGSYQATSYSSTGASMGAQTGAGYQYQTSTAPAAASVNPYHQSGQYQSSAAISSGTGSHAPASSNQSASTGYTNPYTAMYAENSTSSYGNSYYGQSNTYSQSAGMYGDASANATAVQSKYSDYSSKAPTATAPVASATMLPPTSAGGTTGQAQSAATVSSGQQNTANWNTGSYGDYSQYYGQYYGQ